MSICKTDYVKISNALTRKDTSSGLAKIVRGQQLDHADDQTVNFRLLDRRQKMHVPKVLRRTRGTTTIIEISYRIRVGLSSGQPPKIQVDGVQYPTVLVYLVTCRPNWLLTGTTGVFRSFLLLEIRGIGIPLAVEMMLILFVDVLFTPECTEAISGLGSALIPQIP